MKNRNQEAALVLLGGILLAVIAIGQEKRQEWTLKPGRTPGHLHLSIEIHKPRQHWTHSTDVPADRFAGLSADPFSHTGPAKFEYVQDAGKFLCQGAFSWSKGSGTFTFVADPKFPGELEKLGYSAPDTEQVFQMMLGGVTLDFARAAKDAGVRAASSGQLLDMRNHGVTLEFIQELKKSGYDKLRADDLIRLRDHGVSAGFMAELKESGYELSVDRIVELRNHGVNSRYLAELKGHGLQPSVPEIIRLRDNGVTPEYMKTLQDAGYGDMTAEQITRMKQHGVPAEFAAEAKELGYHFTPGELIDMRNHGVNTNYLRRLRDSGMKNLTAAQITKLKSHGVD